MTIPRIIALVTLLAACQTQPSYLGDWQIVDSIAGQISAMSREDADRWRGARIVLTAQGADVMKNVCKTPEYASRKVGVQAFELNYRMPARRLGIVGDDVEVIDIRCKGDWRVPGSELFIVSDDRLVFLWDGMFFLVSRVAT